MNQADRLLEFFSRQIESVEQLEILALLQDKPSECWTAATLSRELRSSESSIGKRLNALVREGILTSPQGEPPCYRLSSPEVEALIQEALSFYRQRPHRVMEILYDRTNTVMRTFADAFRFKKDRP